ncbi:DUF4864 domain-containing protein [Inquilinus sp. Marseille-Q2685]|uniref:DUF4864 domain-containing protein n=1 Tax=Inquilinus sp. Marseille-Q2685 TaxID=2866581 RepID=UPI001CE47171|nr:DUF4864 domain-containing protein [Inquilinus sp. Marseille-Q2685]
MGLVCDVVGRVLALLLLISMPAFAQAPVGDADNTMIAADTTIVGNADGAAIIGVIRKQLDAFQGDRAAEAFGYASPNIQHMFGTPDRFMAMVREGYQPVYRPRSVDFRELVTSRGRIVQKVLFVGPDGVPVIAEYIMERQPDGSWRIDGCRLDRSGDRSA